MSLTLRLNTWAMMIKEFTGSDTGCKWNFTSCKIGKLLMTMDKDQVHEATDSGSGDEDNPASNTGKTFKL